MIQPDQWPDWFRTLALAVGALLVLTTAAALALSAPTTALLAAIVASAVGVVWLAKSRLPRSQPAE